MLQIQQLTATEHINYEQQKQIHGGGRSNEEIVWQEYSDGTRDIVGYNNQGDILFEGNNNDSYFELDKTSGFERESSTEGFTMIK
jgi:hypothetical protein